MHRTAVNTTEASDAAAQMVHAIRKHSGPKQFPFSAAAAAARLGAQQAEHDPLFVDLHVGPVDRTPAACVAAA